MSRRPSVTGDKRWIALLGLVVLALGQAATMVVTAFATRDVIEALRLGDETIPLRALFAVASAGLAIFALRTAEGALGEYAGQRYAAAIRRVLFLHMTRIPLSAMSERRAGATALRFVGDLTAFKGWVARGLSRLISACVTIPAAFLILYLLDPRLALAAALPISLIALVIYGLGNPLGQAHADLRSKRARLAAALSERLPQGIALRRSGRIKTELRALDLQSDGIRKAAVHRACLADSVRALPDAAAGAAGALCLWACLKIGLSVGDAVAALTALALIVWPLRHLADVRDREKAFSVACAKLDAALSRPRLPALAKTQPDITAPAIELDQLALPGLTPLTATVQSGELKRLEGPASSGKSLLLLTLAGLEQTPRGGVLKTLGRNPAALRCGDLLYLGPHSPVLKGSLRRNLILGTGQTPDDAALHAALKTAGLSNLRHRLNGLDGQVSEGARNLTFTERSRLYLARGLIARANLALVDADEIGLQEQDVQQLLAHFRKIGTATLIVSSDYDALHFDSEPLVLAPCDPGSLHHISRAA